MDGRCQIPIRVLAFEPELEKAYQEQALERGIRMARAAAALATPSIPLFAIWDRQVAPDAANSVVLIRVLIVIGFLLAWVLTYTPAVRFFTVIEVIAFASITIGLSAIYVRLDVFEIAAPSLLLPFAWIPVVAVRMRQAIIDAALTLAVPLWVMSAVDVERAIVINMVWWFAVGAVFSIGSWIIVDHAYRRLFWAERALSTERERSESLLRNVLPDDIAERLKSSSDHVAERFDEVTVLFADLVGFTAFSAKADASEVVALLNGLFSQFDDLVADAGAEKIKTIGDGYMAAAGVPKPVANHAEMIVDLALAMSEVTGRFSIEHGLDWQIRLGVHTGELVAGVIGKRKFAYDLWGDTVNVASRIESAGTPGEVHVSIETATSLGNGFRMSEPTRLNLRGHGTHDIITVYGREEAMA